MCKCFALKLIHDTDHWHIRWYLEIHLVNIVHKDKTGIVNIYTFSLLMFVTIIKQANRN